MLSVEDEPTRCRRTDGKKWRCSNKVLPFQKYCERHMHRGRKRSRKLVESSSSYDVAASSSAPSTKHDNTYGLDSYNESQSVLHGTMSVSSNAQVVTIASLPSARDCDNVTPPSLEISESTDKSVSHGDRSRRNMEMSYDDFIKKREPVRGIYINQIHKWTFLSSLFHGLIRFCSQVMRGCLLFKSSSPRYLIYL